MRWILVCFNCYFSVRKLECYFARRFIFDRSIYIHSNIWYLVKNDIYDEKEYVRVRFLDLKWKWRVYSRGHVKSIHDFEHILIYLRFWIAENKIKKNNTRLIFSLVYTECVFSYSSSFFNLSHFRHFNELFTQVILARGREKTNYVHTYFW